MYMNKSDMQLKCLNILRAVSSVCVSVDQLHTQSVVCVLRSPEETIRLQGAKSNHLIITPDAHVPPCRHQSERHKSDNGETTLMSKTASL